MRTPLQSIITVLLLLTITGLSRVLACMDPVHPEYNRITFLDAYILNDPIYSMYVYENERMMYYDYERNSYCTRRETRDENLREWHQYFKQQVPVEALSELIYDAPVEKIEYVYLNLLHHHPVDLKVISNVALLKLATDKDIEALRYLVFAKQCEPHALNDYWNSPHNTEHTVSEAELQSHKLALLEVGKGHYRVAALPFFKLRYAFQVVKIAFYAKQWNVCSELYDQLVPQLSVKNQLQRRALGYKAGAMVRLNEICDAKYIFARLFHESLNEPDYYYHRLWFFNFRQIDPDRKYLHCRPKYLSSEEVQKAYIYYGLIEQLTTQEADAHVWSEYHYGTVAEEVVLLREMKKLEKFFLSGALTMPARVDGLAYAPPADEWALKQAVPTSAPSIWQRISGFFSRWWKPTQPQLFTVNSSATPGSNRFDHPAENQPLARALRAGHLESLRFDINWKLKQGQLHQPALWYICAAYVEILRKDYNAADVYLDKAEKLSRAGNTTRQIKVLRVLSLLTRHEQPMDAVLAQRIIDDVKWITIHQPNPQWTYWDWGYSGRTSEEAYSYEHWRALKQDHYGCNESSEYQEKSDIGLNLLKVIGQKYVAQEDIARAILCFWKTNEWRAPRLLLDIYASQEDIEKLKQLVASGGSNDFEKFLLKDFHLNINHLTEIQATRLMRDHKFVEAKAVFEQLPVLYWAPGKDQWKQLFTHPALNSLNSLTHSDKVSFNKLTFARKIVELEQSTKTDAHHADQYYFQVANLFFNTPFWGYNGLVWNGFLADMIWRDDNDFPLNVEGFATRMYSRKMEFINSYGTRYTARSYYQRVISTTKDPELKLRSIVLARYCNHNPHASFTPFLGKRAESDSVYRNLFLGNMNQQVYTRLLQECPGLKEFMN